MNKVRAFTLIELLVVISVIAILLAILIPALGKAKELAQRTVCRGNLKNYVIAMSMYLNDNDDKFCNPDTCYFSQGSRFPVESGMSSNYIHLRWCNGDIDLVSHPEYGGTLYPYMKNARAFICPTFKNLASKNSEDQFFMAEGSNIKNYEPWYNYTMNGYLGIGRSSVAKSRVANANDVKNPAETFSFTEESSLVDTAYNQSGLNDTYMLPGDDTMVQRWLSQVGSPRAVIPGPEGVGQFYDVIAGFHGAPSSNLLAGDGNCAFLDSHVDAHSRAETFYLAWPKEK